MLLRSIQGAYKSIVIHGSPNLKTGMFHCVQATGANSLMFLVNMYKFFTNVGHCN